MGAFKEVEIMSKRFLQIRESNSPFVERETFAGGSGQRGDLDNIDKGVIGPCDEATDPYVPCRHGHAQVE